MERDGTTKTFVVSTKIFVDAQNRRMQEERLLACVLITKASVSRWETFLLPGVRDWCTSISQKSEPVGLIPDVGASMLVCPKKIAEKNSGDSQC
jgi:hypothetical protein